MRLKRASSPPLGALVLLAVATGTVGAATVTTESAIPQTELYRVAREARQVIAVIAWFYVQNRTCPQPSRPAELARLQRDLGDGYAVRVKGRFVELRGIAMSASWLYYAPPGHPGKCTLWRPLGAVGGSTPVLIWRRDAGVAWWGVEPGDGRPEQRLADDPARP